ncbi:MAG: hypothetical protein CM15mP115_08580 [Alphaproteobacteria bacterium]|nr:MAG: hypothetical protein CM15mP115_08580 [Alphaproteobacteria bacterium]
MPEDRNFLHATDQQIATRYRHHRLECGSGRGPAYPEAEGDITADWLVIGGGFAGLSAAKRLTELRGGDSIILLEAGRIGEGPPAAIPVS